MGHFYTDVRGVGKNKAEALEDAKGKFFDEEGHRHSLRGIDSSRLIQKVPPKKTVETIEGLGARRVRVIRSQEDPTAPQSEWLEEWEFVLHTHA